jgi:hypothetical protein
LVSGSTRQVGDLLTTDLLPPSVPARYRLASDMFGRQPQAALTLNLPSPTHGQTFAYLSFFDVFSTLR